jgi:hypothetical protein
MHAAIYTRALERPGLVVIHDAVLHHFFLGTLTQEQYVAEFLYNYGTWTLDLARELWDGRAHSATDPRYFRYPMLKRIAQNSLGVIVHNPAAAHIVRSHAPQARIFEVPHLFEPPPPATPVRVASQFVCGVFGYLRESKRLHSVIRAIRRLNSVTLLIAGEFASDDLERSLQSHLESSRIVRLHYLNETEFWRYASGVDTCINLRYPAAGESSGIAVRLMGIGKPVILTAGLENSRFPETACLRVDPGESEEDMLANYLRWLAANRSDALEIGERAQAFVRHEHALDRVAGLYWHAIRHCYDDL